MWDKTDSGVISLKKGFTLIEVMIVIAIVGILAAVAIPAYQDYLDQECKAKPSTCSPEQRKEIAERKRNAPVDPSPTITPEPHEFVDGVSRAYTKCIGGTIYLVTDGQPVQVLDSRSRPVACSE